MPFALSGVTLSLSQGNAVETPYTSFPFDYAYGSAQGGINMGSEIDFRSVPVIEQFYPHLG